MRYSIICIMFILWFILPRTSQAVRFAQDDTVKAPEVSVLPQIDGEAADACWDLTEWQAIDQVWIEYGTTIDPADFSGRYKVVWSDSENLLYFLVDIVDDVIVDGYQYNSNPQTGGGYPNYDIVEVFIDPDKSGGLHVFDGTGSTGEQWGTNAENAFSYHITTDIPDNGEVSTEIVVCDIAGKHWGDYYIPDFASHLPEFALKQTDGHYVWEFSLAVYDHSYDEADPEASRIDLETQTLMGLSLAYCDNDDPEEDPKERDHFFGSVWVPEEAYNDHWMDADGFGTIQLTSGATGIYEETEAQISNVNLFPNPSSGLINLRMNHPNGRNVKLAIYNILGQKVLNVNSEGTPQTVQKRLNLNGLPAGVYFLRAQVDGRMILKKFTLLNK